jgi:hypothetical protein
MKKTILASGLLSLFACEQAKTIENSNDNVDYISISYPGSNFTAIQGIRGVVKSEDVYIAGTYTMSNDSITHGVVYKGPLYDSKNLGKWYALDYTSSQFNDVTLTSCYGPNNGTTESIQVVGAYKRDSTGNRNLGFLYEGSLSGNGKWKTITPGGSNKDEVYDVFVHSTMGGLAVGNYDLKGKPTSGYSFIYDIKNQTDITYMVDNSYTTTLYGIWHNGDNSYTLAGGYTTLELGKISQAFLVDYDFSTKQFSHFKAFNYNNEPKSSIITHFEGITASADGGYNMPADWVTVDSTKLGASLVSVNRNSDGSFSEAVWEDISYPGAMITSANTAYRNNILGIYVINDSITNTKITLSYNAKL